MDVSREYILEQLELQAQNFESTGDQSQADQVRDLINKANENRDSATIGINMTIRIDKFDGEIKDGDKPVETIVFNGE